MSCITATGLYGHKKRLLVKTPLWSKKGSGSGIFIERGTDNMCEEREGEQTDRKSHCDSKQSSITSACVFHGALSRGSAENNIWHRLQSSGKR